MDPIQGMTTNMINPAIPLQNPLFIFTVIILTILLAPLVFKLIKIPDVAAYLLAGIILGPFGFCILDRDPSVVLLGTIGLLYIMFLAGFVGVWGCICLLNGVVQSQNLHELSRGILTALTGI